MIQETRQEQNRIIRQTKKYWNSPVAERTIPKDPLGEVLVESVEELSKHPLISKVVAGFDRRIGPKLVVVGPLEVPSFEQTYHTADGISGSLPFDRVYGLMEKTMKRSGYQVYIDYMPSRIANAPDRKLLKAFNSRRPITYLGTTLNPQAA